MENWFDDFDVEIQCEELDWEDLDWELEHYIEANKTVELFDYYANDAE